MTTTTTTTTTTKMNALFIIIRSRLLLVLLFFIVAFCWRPHSLANAYTVQSLYDAQKDHVLILNASVFKSVVYGSDRATFVENYAHWCGACQRFAAHWKEVARETKYWHARVIRVAAINCGESFNDNVCREQEIKYYPTLKLFPAQAKHEAKDHDAVVVKSDKSEVLINKMITFVEQQPNKPASWPDLTPFTSKRFDPLFAFAHDVKYAFVIFEPEESFVGRRIILDFSPYVDRLIIRRVTEKSNPHLFAKLTVNPKALPVVYLINNTKPFFNPIKFDLDALRKYVKLKDLKKLDDSETYGVDLGSGNELIDKLPQLSDRLKYTIMIRKFLAHSNLFAKKDLIDSALNDASAAVISSDGLVQQQQSNQARDSEEEADKILKNIKDRVYVQDLESSLHYMLRSEISRHDEIKGEEMEALKKWLNTLAKYFPGRESVMNYLKEVNHRLSQLTEISGNEWKELADTDKAQMSLPRSVEWRHCKGSDPKYRGYPCSLWSLFHMLTVSQIEIEKQKAKPFDADQFNVREVVEAVIGFVKHFFGCKECSNNFIKETENYLVNLNKPEDAIIYLWKVHNNVNQRLANENKQSENGVNDPKFPKVQFPTKEQCPKCYPGPNDDEEWNKAETLLFLQNFYSKEQLQGVDDLNDLYLDNSNNFNRFSEQTTNDFKLGFVIFVFAVSSFGFLFFYFVFLQKRLKKKKHII